MFYDSGRVGANVVLLHGYPQSCMPNPVEGFLEVHEDMVKSLLVLEIFLNARWIALSLRRMAALFSKNVWKYFYLRQPSMVPPFAEFLSSNHIFILIDTSPRDNVVSHFSQSTTSLVVNLSAQSCRNKASELNGLVADHDTDMMLLTETWLKEQGGEA